MHPVIMGRISTRLQVFLLLFFFFAALQLCIHAHPQCVDSYAPFDTVHLEFCQEYSMFGCCDAERDSAIKQQYDDLVDDVPLSNCREKLKELLCQECSPYAAHLYTTESDGIKSPLPGLCGSYCTTLHQECASIIPLVTDDSETLTAAANSTTAFCNKVTLDSAYCYPRIREDEDLLSWIEESRYGTGRYAEGCVCFEEFANGLRNPILAVHANDNTHRLFIAEQIGIVHVYLYNKTKLNEPFLDIQSSVLSSTRTGDERGFLGLAFHPNHTTNRKLYVYYSHQSDSQQIRIAEYKTLSDNINKVNTSTERIILEVDQPRANHNGGQLLFGTDGYLYAFLGDGGGAGDRFGVDGNGQNLATLLGSVIRIDIDRQESGKQYGIPPDNPFVNEDPTSKRHESYAYGTRNMWRCSVDRGDPETGEGRGRIFCGDVGQDLYEEVDIIVKGGNYGWRGREGNECYDDDLCEGLENEVLPITVYHHDIGKSVTGGYMYRGCQSPKLQGKYIFGDYVNGRMFKLTEESNSEWYREDMCFGDNTICTSGLVNTYPTKILSFGEDEAGEVYVLTTDRARINNNGGKVFKIIEPSESGNCELNRVPVTVQGSTTNFVPSQPLPDPPPPLPLPPTQPPPPTSPYSGTTAHHPQPTTSHKLTSSSPQDPPTQSQNDPSTVNLSNTAPSFAATTPVTTASPLSTSTTISRGGGSSSPQTNTMYASSVLRKSSQAVTIKPHYPSAGDDAPSISTATLAVAIPMGVFGFIVLLVLIISICYVLTPKKHHHLHAATTTTATNTKNGLVPVQNHQKQKSSSILLPKSSDPNVYSCHQNNSPAQVAVQGTSSL